jgi:hypothetical protein
MIGAIRSTVLLCLASLCFGVAPALAESAGPGLEVSAETLPTNLPPGGEGMINLSVLNLGAAGTVGSVVVTDVLPPDVTAIDAGARMPTEPRKPSHEPELWDCKITPGTEQNSIVTCRNDPMNLPSLTGGGGAPDYSPNRERFDPKITIAVAIAPGASGTALNRVTAAGGGSPASATTTEPVTISLTPAPFGIANFDVWFGNADGSIDTQAGSHPYSATFLLDFNLQGSVHHEGGEYEVTSHVAEQVRDIEVELPPGLVGDPQTTPQCPREIFENDQAKTCPADTQIGVVSTTFSEILEPAEPVFNVVPPPGKPAEFGFTVLGNPAYLDARVRTGSDDGITTDTSNVPQRNIANSIVTLWSNPGDVSHAPWYASPCKSEECLVQRHETEPLLTLPTSCQGPQKFTVRAHPWYKEAITSEASVASHDSNDEPTGYAGCEHLSFAPSITTAPDTARADTPAGLTVEVKPPVGGLTSNAGLSAADIQNTTVTLPEGFVINPGQAAGLQACQVAESAVGTEAAPSCPEAAKVGTDEIETPLLPHALKGNVYVLQSNPPELKLLVAASGEGVNLKLVGIVHLNEQTGQLTTKFEGTPELPFTDFKLSFSGGAQAALDTPTQCGTFGSNADFTPWSSPFVADFLTNAAFTLDEGPGGGACPSNPMPFAPVLTAGSTTDQAGGFTGFSLLLQRGDGQQRIEKLQFKEPAGAAGLISQVPLCPEPQAAQGTCSAASHIGHSVVTSGPGPYPLVIPQPGEPEAPIYLTGPYKGAPFGLSIVTPVIAGPFNLGTIVTRAKIEVDPHTAQITITTDPLPQIVDGVPTDLREVNAIIDRPDFLFNPTSCTPSSFSGTATSAEGAQAAISSPFKVGSCQSLPFSPKFSASIGAKPTKKDGESLRAKIVEGVAGEANVHLVKVELPKQLPSRLTTLQKACLAATFDANPANCPSTSVVGYAKAITPILPVPLEGPAYFVSHGGEAFPDLIIVLQGDGVTIDLVGTTFISKAGITSTTFKTVPDAPVISFELTLPQGPFSALAANGNPCTDKLVIPIEILAQNGAKINERTPISVSGCAKKKTPTRAQKLNAALKVCRKKPKSKHAGCEKLARKAYGPVKKSKQKARGVGSSK